MVGVVMCDVALMNATLIGAELQGGDLSRALLIGADLSGANLFKSDFNNVDVYGASFVKANLCDANFDVRRVSDAELAGALYNSRTIWPKDFSPDNFGLVKVSD